jgi:hypothetical protein
LIGLEKEKADIVQSIENLKKEEYEIRRKIDERRTELADVLKVSNNSEEIARAIRANELRLTQLQALNLKTEQDKSVKVAALRNIESQLSQSNQKKENLEREITERLKIKDFITELQHGIEQSQQEKSNLDKEIAKRQEEIALAETLKNFYVNASDYDFNRFCGWVELLKYIRNHASQTPAIVKMQIEQDVREQALQVFKGFWVSKSEFNTLEIEKNKVVKENDDLKLEVQNLKNSVEKRDEQP